VKRRSEGDGYAVSPRGSREMIAKRAEKETGKEEEKMRSGDRASRVICAERREPRSAIAAPKRLKVSPPASSRLDRTARFAGPRE